VHTSDFPGKCGFDTDASLFSYLVLTFRWDETARSTTEYTVECLAIVSALSQNGYYSFSADAVSFEFINATSQHMMAQTAPLTRLLACYSQFIKDYNGSQVPAHRYFYKRTGEREVGYKRLMIACRRSLLRKNATNDQTIMMATFLQLIQRTIKMVMPAWRYTADRNSPSVTSPNIH